MLLDIFYKKTLIGLCHGSKTSGLTFLDSQGTSKTLYSTYKQNDEYDSLYYLMNRTTYLQTNSYATVFGDGDTPVTGSDYWLSGNQFTKFTSTVVTSTSFDDMGYTITSVYTLTNTGTTEFTVREVGLLANYNISSSGAAYFLCERTVLDTPVTIPVGGVGQVTYTVRCDYPII